MAACNLSRKNAIKIVILGSAAGGGLPQWNCACKGCAAARMGEIPARTQTSVAVSADEHTWFLINASPDLRGQLLSTPLFDPPHAGERSTVIEAILTANADLDHVLGAVLLREGDETLHLHATESVRNKLVWLDALLGPFCGTVWHQPPMEKVRPLLTRAGVPSGMTYRSISSSAAGGKESVAYFLEDCQTGGRLLVASDVGALSSDLLQAMERADLVMWDGTFWSETELSDIAPGKRNASEMGHLPLSSGGLAALQECHAPTKVLIHINNTNPILRPGTPERTRVEDVGIIIAEDGMRFDL